MKKLLTLAVVLILLRGSSLAQQPASAPTPSDTQAPVPTQPLTAVPAESLRSIRIDRGGPPGIQVKNLIRPAGMNSHSLTGYGLVVGLPNTGDSSATLVSPMMTHLLTKLGLEPMLENVQKMKSKNVAVVAITAKLPPVARSGDPIDVEVASLGDAKNLSRGMLLRSLLKGPDDQVYGSAQGRITALPVDDENRVVGVVTQGGTVSRNLESPALARDTLVLTLLKPDLTTATRIANAVGLRLGVACRVISAEAVEVSLSGSGYSPISALAIIEELNIEPSTGTTIVVNRQTKSVVVGGSVPLKPALISHNGVTVEIGPQGSNLKTVLENLSRMGATSDDIVAILESLRQAGSLSGQIEYR